MIAGFLALFLGQLLGSGILTVLLKIGLTEVAPFPLSAMRFLIAAGCIFFLFAKRNHLSFWDKEFRTLFPRSLLFTGNIAFFAFGLQFTTVIMSQLLYLSVPVLVALLAHFLLDEKLHKEKIIGFIIVFCGLGFLLSRSLTYVSQTTFGTLTGNVLILCGCVSWSLYVVLSRKISQKFSSIKMTFSNFLLSALLLMLITPVGMSLQAVHLKNLTTLGVICILGLGIGTVAQYVGMQYGIKKTSATTTGFFQYLGPLFATLFAIPILHEQLTASFVLGGLFVLFGVFYATAFSTLKRKFFPVLQ